MRRWDALVVEMVIGREDAGQLHMFEMPRTSRTVIDRSPGLARPEGFVGLLVCFDV